MILAVDAHYGQTGSIVAGVVFEKWEDAAPIETRQDLHGPPLPYESGQFYKRELPLILDTVSALRANPSIIVVDGYVFLDGSGRKGLGAHLYEALGRVVPVVGVAKTAFKGSPHAAQVTRGNSQMPLYVTTVGMDQDTTAAHIVSMHGPHRIPTLLKLADQLSRESPLS